MTSEAVAGRRLSAQQLVEPRFEIPAELVSWMGAVQAQDYGQSLWGLMARLRTAAPAPGPGNGPAAVLATGLDTVLDAIESGTILRTWPMRGTIHWVPAQDARWMVNIAAHRVLASARTRHTELGVDETSVATAGDLLTTALRGGRRLARPAVMQLWQDGGLRTDGQRGYHLLWTLAHHGEIAIGPMDGKQQTFVLLDDRSDHRSLTPDEGLALLAVRYATSHGPVTDRDFAWWTGTTLTAARKALRTGAESGELVIEDLEGREWWSAVGAPPQAGPSGVRLLASFDEFVLGYQGRADTLDPAHFQRIVPGANGIFHPAVLVDGIVSGVWKRTFTAKGVRISVEMFRRGARKREIVDAVEAFARVYDTPVVGLTLDL